MSRIVNYSALSPMARRKVAQAGYTPDAGGKTATRTSVKQIPKQTTEATSKAKEILTYNAHPDAGYDVIETVEEKQAANQARAAAALAEQRRQQELAMLKKQETAAKQAALKVPGSTLTRNVPTEAFIRQKEKEYVLRETPQEKDVRQIEKWEAAAYTRQERLRGALGLKKPLSERSTPGYVAESLYTLGPNLVTSFPEQVAIGATKQAYLLKNKLIKPKLKLATIPTVIPLKVPAISWVATQKGKAVGIDYERNRALEAGVKEATDPKNIAFAAVAAGVGVSIPKYAEIRARGVGEALKPGEVERVATFKERTSSGVRREATLREVRPAKAPTSEAVYVDQIKPSAFKRASESVKNTAKRARETVKEKAQASKEWLFREKDRAKAGKDLAKTTKDIAKTDRTLTKTSGLDLFKTRPVAKATEVARPRSGEIIRQSDIKAIDKSRSSDLYDTSKRDIVPKERYEIIDRTKEITRYNERLIDRTERIIEDRTRPTPTDPTPRIGGGIPWPSFKLDLSPSAGGGLFPKYGNRGGKSKRGKKGYAPSIGALTFNIKGKRPTSFTGLEFRPIIK